MESRSLRRLDSTRSRYRRTERRVVESGDKYRKVYEIGRRDNSVKDSAGEAKDKPSRKSSSKSSAKRSSRGSSSKDSILEKWKDYPDLQSLIKQGLINTSHLEIVTKDPADVMNAYESGGLRAMLPSGMTVDDYDILYDVLEACKELTFKGLTDSQFKNIPVKKYSKDVCENKECNICFNDFKAGEKLMILPCESKHGFHQDCIRPWFDYSRSCPICRGSCVVKNADGTGGDMRFKRSVRVRACVDAVQRMAKEKKID